MVFTNEASTRAATTAAYKGLFHRKQVGGSDNASSQKQTQDINIFIISCDCLRLILQVNTKRNANATEMNYTRHTYPTKGT